MVSIGLVDDHPLMIEGIITLFSRAQGLEISSTGSTARDIIDISSRFRPDVIIVDLSMAGDVYAAIAMSIKVSPNTKIVAFTAATGVDSAIRALDAGANGYVLKGSSAQELIQAVRVLLDLFTVKFLHSYGTRPAHLFGLMGLASGGLGFALLAYLAVLKVFFDEAIGGRPLLLLGALLFLTGVILVSFGLMGELLVRTWHESQGKPIYVVQERRPRRGGEAPEGAR